MQDDFSLSLILINLAGAIALLLWSVRMVRTGMERAYGAAIRRWMRSHNDHLLRAGFSGIVIAIALQSSTAVAMLGASFTLSAGITSHSGLAMLLGADLGSALVTIVLSFPLTWLIPLLFLFGAILFLRGAVSQTRQLGRIMMGLGLIFLSLQLVKTATNPLQQEAFLATLIAYLRSDLVSAFLLGAILTYCLHSSVAAILLFAAIAEQQMIPLDITVPLVLGANLGSGLIAIVLTWTSQNAVRRIPIANGLFRAVFSLLLLFVCSVVPVPLALSFSQWAGPAGGLIGVHVAFNFLLFICCLPLAPAMARFVIKTFPDQHQQDAFLTEPGYMQSRLEQKNLTNPELALAGVTREILRMSEIIEIMFRPIMDLYQSCSDKNLEQIRKLEKEINKTHSAIKLYLARLHGGQLSGDEARRSMVLANFAINLEAAGDVIARNLLSLAQNRQKKQLKFSRPGWIELTDLHNQVLGNMQLALNVLVSSDAETARQLIEEKDRLRKLERRSYKHHLLRLRSGQSASIESSDIHLETVRAFKQINSYYAYIAYPLLYDSGELLQSRLAQR